MKKHAARLLPGMLGLALFLIWSTGAWPGDPPLSKEDLAQKGVEVLTRGPVHEAFAEPLNVNPRPNPIIATKPPVAIEEIPPDQKPEGSHIQWIPGYFGWDEASADYIWISGLWRATPPGRQWMPGHWILADGGWQWVSGYWAAAGQGEVEYLPPPPPSIEMGPSVEAVDADSLYTPGCWVYQQRRYLWRPGFWQRARADWFYRPAYYCWTPAGCIFSDGYWDYPWERRGMLFAPVRFAQEVWGWSRWNYQPRYVVSNQALLGSLFARADFGHYYFGNYYAPEFNRLGFVPWFDHRMGRNVPDPFFNYSRWQSRAQPNWEANLRGLHKDRLAEIAPRPPITLVQQSQVIQNVTINKTVKTGTKTVNVTDPQNVIRHMTLIAPLTKLEHKEFKLQPVVKATDAEERKAVQQFQRVALERQKREAKIVSEGSFPSKPTDPPTKVNVEFPKVIVPSKSVIIQTPPLPVIPKHVEQPLPKHETIKPVRVDVPKGRDKGPAQIQEAPRSKEIDRAPSKSKDKDSPPPRSKEKEKQSKAVEVQRLTSFVFLRRAQLCAPRLPESQNGRQDILQWNIERILT